MIKKTIKFTDFDGNPVERDYYFHLFEAELMDMQMGEYGGLDKLLTRIIEEKDSVKIYKYFTSIIKASYGEKSNDGICFNKSEELSNRFIQSNAYSELIMELIGDSDKAAEFVNGILPNKAKENKQSIPAPPIR